MASKKVPAQTVDLGSNVKETHFSRFRSGCNIKDPQKSIEKGKNYLKYSFSDVQNTFNFRVNSIEFKRDWS